MMQENAIIATSLRNSTLRAMRLIAEDAETIDNPDQALAKARELIDAMTPSDMQKMMKDAEDRGYGQSTQIVDLQAGVEVQVEETDSRRLAMSMLAVAASSYHREVKDATGVTDVVENVQTDTAQNTAEQIKLRQGKPRR